MATYSPTKLGRCYIVAQTSFSGGKTATQAIDNGHVVECEAFVPTNAREVHPREAVRGGYHAIGPVSGSQGGQNTITLTMKMHGVSSSVPSGQPSANAEAAILGSILGGQTIHNFNSAVVDSSGSDADTIDGPGGSYKAGTGMNIRPADSTPGYEMGFIENAQSDTAVELRTPFTATASPQNGSNTHGTVSSWLHTAETTAFTILVRSLDNNSQTLAQGCVPTSVSITLDAKGAPTMEATFWVNTIERSAASSALSEYAYSLPVLPAATGNAAARLCYGQSSATAFDVESFSVSIEQEVQPQLSHDATSGYGDVTVTNRAVTCSFSSIAGAATPWDSGDLSTIFDLNNVDDATGSKAIQLTLGNTPGSMLGLHIPVPLLTAPPSLADLNGTWGVTHECAAGRYTGDTASSSESSTANSFVIALG